jgi:DNA invertase Pin-like site-specific DNA recombinase
MIYGYARVSTSDQKPDLQILALQEAGCESIVVETASGADRLRPELAKCLAKLQSGDVMVV